MRMRGLIAIVCILFGLSSCFVIATATAGADDSGQTKTDVSKDTEEKDAAKKTETDGSDSSDAIDLGVITVTSTSPGGEDRIEDVQASVQVFTQKDIQALSMRSTAQVLEWAAGLRVTDTGANSSISIRGFNDYNTLLLVNGLRSTGNFHRANLTNISLEDIEKIEIIRGPMSALYGADASAGIVNIITKKGSEKMGGSVSLNAGVTGKESRNSLIARASLNSGKIGDTTHRLSFEAVDKGELRLDPEASSDLPTVEHHFANYSGAWEINDNRNLKWNAEYQKQDDVYNFIYYGAFEGGYELERYRLDANYNDKNAFRIIDLSVNYEDSDGDINLGAAEHYEHSLGEANGYVTLFPVDNLTMVAGTGGRFENANATSFPEEKDRNVYHVLGQFDYEIIPDVNLVAGVRHEDFDDFGQSTNPRVSLGYSPGGYNFRVGYGKGFRAPLYHEMYRMLVRGVTLTKGNPDLEPEKTQTYEAAAGYRCSLGAIEVVYHHSDIENLIETVRGTPTQSDLETYPGISYISQYRNISEAEIKGIEAKLSTKILDFWDLNLTYDYLDARDAQTDERLEERARHTVKILNAFQLYEGLYAYVNVAFYRDYLGTSAPIGTRGIVESFDYEDIDIKLSYRFNKTFEFYAGIDNLLEDIDNPLAKADPYVRYFYGGVTCKF